MKNINLRLDDDLHGHLKHLADLDRRSLQQEIIYLLTGAAGRRMRLGGIQPGTDYSKETDQR